MANVISISVVFFFLIPTILISCMYSHMAIKLWRSQKGFIKTFGRKFTPKPKIKEDSENLFNKQSSHSKFNESNFETRNKDQLRMSKVRRSRRDVIKMLCMFFFNIFNVLRKNNFISFIFFDSFNCFSLYNLLGSFSCKCY